MADSVQHALDRMVSDLDDLRHRGIFAEMEIRSIVAKRREFEYLLRRYEARKLDYMRYVEYELNLESLRSLRTKRIRAGRKKKNSQSSMSDTSCTRLIRWIFDRAVLKFPGDVDLWLHYIDFAAQQGQSKTLGRLCARALQLHPRNAGLWIKAASWEFFEAGNTSSARALMQRGLRINPSAQKLWLQYFRLEFYYVEKIMGRREVLGLGEGRTDDAAENAVNGGPAGKDQGDGDAMDIPQLEGEGDGSGGPSFKAVRKASASALKSNPGTVMNDTARKFYRGAVPLAVYRAAVKAVPHDVEFRAGFLRCCTLEFPSLGGEVAEAIVASVSEDFPESCEAWELRAMYPLLIAQGSTKTGKSRRDSIVPAFEDSKGVFENAVEAIGARDPDIWVRYAMFLQRRIEELDDEGTGARRGGDDDSGVARAAVAAVAPTADVLAKLMMDVLARAVEMHVDTNHDHFVLGAAPSSSSGDGPVERNEMEVVELQTLATRKELSAKDANNSRANAQEALGVGLADVCLALQQPERALEALRATTCCLPTRPGPWLRLASLERRVNALARRSLDQGREGSMVTTQSHGGRSRSGRASRDGSIATIRKGLRAVPATDPGYPALWRALLGSLLAGGAGKKAIAIAFREAIEACAPSGADQGDAQGEFLTGYLRWSGAVDGIEAARRALQWSRRSFLLAGTGAAPVYFAAIELERMLGSAGEGRDRGVSANDATGTAKRIRELFEDAANKFGDEMPSIWEEYAQFELQEGDVKRANAIRWRAQQISHEKPGGTGNGTFNKRQKRG